MKFFTGLFITILVLEAKAQKLHFLEGCWETKLPHATIREEWVLKNSQLIEGRFRRLEAGQVVEEQNYRIELNDPPAKDILSVFQSGIKIGIFVGEATGRYWFFENQKPGEFPTAIHYRDVFNKKIRIWIKGANSGENLEYEMKSVSCN